MVVSGDRYEVVFEVFDGLVAAAVSEFEFVGLGPDGVRDDLVTEADTEDWIIVEETTYGFVYVG